MISNTFPHGSYRKSEDADMMDKKAAAEYQQEKKDFARYRCVQYTFNGKIKNSRGRFKTNLAPVFFRNKSSLFS